MDKSQQITIGKRRYIGCKAKLAEWIMQTINAETDNIHKFCDIFAGTAIISDLAIQKYEKVIINDFLYSNNLIYKAFYAVGEIDKDKLSSTIDTFNQIDTNLLDDNYFSINYGNKFFDYQTAKKIGYIRDFIEEHKQNYTEKEYNILIASLIYSIDKIANTLGHYEAFIRKEIKPKNLVVNIIDYKSISSVEIYRENANQLARTISADIFYIDPPYNSRQYSRFYHLYENLVTWQKPILHGTAMKPTEANMSEYCSSRATKVFEDLISHLNTKYIAVSYNNTYHSKSNSSKNKITLENIMKILSKRGQTKVFEHSHPFFNAGKSDFSNHKELLFITKVNEE